MYLKKLEISGFKSFADKTTLEFTRGVSGVVGPNGSGKSNIVEAIRWVMGEQSMKNLRTKKGDDLIFAGTPKRAKIGKAKVSLIFDNKDKIFPIDFEEVVISRQVFRDGENQYFINNSQVRLKDIAELIAKAKLGLKGYSIISQGMGDVILSASPKERREILDEAIGLKEFQLKKNEAIFKLENSKNNLNSVKSIIGEITPHLKFLKKQIEKIRQKETLESQLKEVEMKYFAQKFSDLKRAKKEIEEVLAIVLAEISKTEKILKEKKAAIALEEKNLLSFFEELKKLENQLEIFEEKKGNTQREAGKIEAAIEIKTSILKNSLRSVQSKDRIFQNFSESLNFKDIEKELAEIAANIKKIADLNSLEEMKNELKTLLEKFDVLFEKIKTEKKAPILEQKSFEVSAPAAEHIQEAKISNEEIEKNNLEKSKILSVLASCEKEINSLKEKIRQLNFKNQKEKENFYNLKSEIKDEEAKLLNLKEKGENLNFELQKIVSDESELKKEKDFADEKAIFAIVQSVNLAGNLEDLRKEIERIKIKLEMLENIDPEIQKEYEETEKRHNFLTSQAEDLEKAIVSLDGLIFDLDKKIEDRFSDAFEKINKEFDKFFKIIFNGGSASLKKVKIRAIKTEAEEELEAEFPIENSVSESQEAKKEENEKAEKEGIEIQADLPKKRIRNINMLSGGERALTAIALLISLVSISKPPFLVLDEIDAPLDESNSQRFGKILGELSENTQFVVITHNRETMKIANILYGVTMAGDGVSRVLSLKL